MSSLADLTAARDERRAEVEAALADLNTAALTTQTSATFETALSLVQKRVKDFWRAGHSVDAAARREGGA